MFVREQMIDDGRWLGDDYNSWAEGRVDAFTRHETPLGAKSAALALRIFARAHTTNAPIMIHLYSRTHIIYLSHNPDVVIFSLPLCIIHVMMRFAASWW